MTFGSLFSGIGGMDLGLERAGMTCKWQVEIDPFCQKVLTKHWPEVPKYGDIREVSGLPSVDLIAGGFPCQDVSRAGKQEGITGERSGLWSEFHRIICEIRPRFVLVENVPGLLDGGIATVLGDLAGIGYDAEWSCVSAAEVGAKHLRKRIFIVAYPGGAGSPFTEQTTTRGCGRSGRDATDSGCGKVSLADLECARLEGNFRGIMADRESFAGHIAGRRSEFPAIASREDGASESWVLRGIHGISDRVDRVKSLGNSVVPQAAEAIGRRIIEADE